MNSSSIEIGGYVPGAIGRVTEMHARYYSECWGFDLFFESKVASELSDFLNRLKDGRDKFWTALANKNVVGSIAIDGIKAFTHGAHLRWFIVDPVWQGSGMGNLLLKNAVDFCVNTGFRNVYLWTFSGLDCARHLYEKFGFSLVEERRGMQWGREVTEQKFELQLY